MEFGSCLLFIPLADFQHQQLVPSVGKFKRKAMAPVKKVVSIVESSEDHSMQEQMANMIAMMEASTQQVVAANPTLEEIKEIQVELNAKIIELQQENQFLRETQKKMQYDPCNPEIEENEMFGEFHRT